MDAEGVQRPLVGQSMGGYVAQVFDGLFPGRSRGIVSVDSAPLGRGYYKSWELACLPFVTRMFRLYPWGHVEAHERRGQRRDSRGPRHHELDPGRLRERGVLSAFRPWFAMLAEVVRSDEYAAPTAPLTLIVGELDRTGFVRKYNELWSKRTGLPVRWVEGAAHNSNADNPAAVNAIIEEASAATEIAPSGLRWLQALAAASQLANDRAQMFGARLASFQTIV